MYEETTDNTLEDLNVFQEFLYRSIKDYESYDDIRPLSCQPAKLSGTTKFHMFKNLENITPQNLNYCRIINHTETFTFKAVKVISSYFKTNVPKQIFHLRYSAIPRYAFKFTTIKR